LQPWHENLKKRQVKTPKVYLRDTGILHSLLNIPGMSELWGHPRLGASWEGFTLEQVLCTLRTNEAYFWATQGGAELDLLFFSGGRRFGVECKFSEAPKVTKSMHSALEDLSLTHLWVVYPGQHRYPAHEKITILPLSEVSRLPEEIAALTRVTK
jgi:predicted AAA+ superfamily ATPase